MITGFTVMLVLLVLTPVFQNMSANVQVRARRQAAPALPQCGLHPLHAAR